ncbi:hypothetical protein ACA910_014631 [Epithemia clementina (nom. ined.)]
MALMVLLALRDLSKQMVSGLFVKTWDAFDTAEYICLGNGIEGKVTAVGLVETCISGYDNITTQIPNLRICHTRLCNLLRMQKPQQRGDCSSCFFIQHFLQGASYQMKVFALIVCCIVVIFYGISWQRSVALIFIFDRAPSISLTGVGQMDQELNMD